MGVRVAAAEIGHFHLPADFRVFHLHAGIVQVIDHVPDLVPVCESRHVGVVAQQDAHGHAARVAFRLGFDLLVEALDTLRRPGIRERDCPGLHPTACWRKAPHTAPPEPVGQAVISAIGCGYCVAEFRVGIGHVDKGFIPVAAEWRLVPRRVKLTALDHRQHRLSSICQVIRRALVGILAGIKQSRAVSEYISPGEEQFPVGQAGRCRPGLLGTGGRRSPARSNRSPAGCFRRSTSSVVDLRNC